MFEAFLVSTSTEGLQPLGTAPQRAYELVSSTVRARLGDTHANLFAEPVATEHGDMMDWYAPMAGAAVPLPDLPEAVQQAVCDRLGALVADIRAVAGQHVDNAGRQTRLLKQFIDVVGGIDGRG